MGPDASVRAAVGGLRKDSARDLFRLALNAWRFHQYGGYVDTARRQLLDLKADPFQT